MITFLENIKEIPDRLDALLGEYDQIRALLQGNPRLQRCRRIAVVGSGTSLNAAHTAKFFGEALLGSPIPLYHPNPFVNYSGDVLLAEDTLYIFISQGGKTKLVYEAVEKVKARGLASLSITENPASPIARMTDVAFDMGTGFEPYMYRTTGYSATVTLLNMIFMALAEAREAGFSANACLDDMRAAVDNLDTLRRLSLDWYDDAAAKLQKHDFFWFAGAGNLYPVAKEADIKFMEMLPVHSTSFELEEFMHGPQNAFTSQDGYFLLHKGGEDDEKVEQIRAFLTRELGAPCYLLSDTTTGEGRIVLPVRSERFYALEYITFFQVLAYRLAEGRKRDLSHPIYPAVSQYYPKSID